MLCMIVRLEGIDRLKKQKKWLIIAALVLCAAFAVPALAAGITGSQTQTDTLEQEETQQDTSLIYEYSTNENEILDLMSDNVLIDRRAGVIFDLPVGFTYIDKDEYYIIYNPDHQDGSIQLIANSDYRCEDGFYQWQTVSRLKERTSWMIDGKELKTVLYEYNEVPTQTEYSEDLRSFREPASFYTQGGNELVSRYEHWAVDFRGVALGYGVKTGSDDMSYFDDALTSIMNSCQPITYDYTIYADPEVLAFEPYTFHGVTIDVPVAWDIYEVSSNTVVLKAPVMGQSGTLNGSVILQVTQESNNYNSASEHLYALDTTLQSTNAIANSLLQNPYVDNNRKLTSILSQDQYKYKNINGRDWHTDLFNCALVTANTAIMTSFPEKVVQLRPYVTALNENENLAVIFTAIPSWNEYDMELFATRMMKTIE